MSRAVDHLASKRLVAIAIGVEGSLGVLAWGLAWILGEPLGGMWRWDAEAVATGVGLTLPPLGFLLWSARSTLPALERIRGEVREALGPLVARASPLELAALAALAGLGEEGPFRGVLQGWAVRHVGAVAGLAAASAAFGVVHAVTPTYAVLAAVVGAYLGALYLAFDNLAIPIAVHALYDLVGLVWLRQATKGGPARAPDGGRNAGGAS